MVQMARLGIPVEYWPQYASGQHTAGKLQLVGMVAIEPAGCRDRAGNGGKAARYQIGAAPVGTHRAH